MVYEVFLFDFIGIKKINMFKIESNVRGIVIVKRIKYGFFWSVKWIFSLLFLLGSLRILVFKMFYFVVFWIFRIFGFVFIMMFFLV